MTLPRHVYHDAGERITVPLHLSMAGAWRVAAELIRRHPEELYALELHPATGQYSCVSIFSRTGDEHRNHPALLHFNYAGRGHITGKSWRGGDDLRFNWLDVLFARDFREEIIVPLERDEGLTSPSQTPPTTRQSIGARLVAEALLGRALSNSPMVAANGVYDSSGMGGSYVCDFYFKEFGTMIEQISGRPDSDLNGHPAYRFWFICIDERKVHNLPILGIDSWHGRVWSRTLNGADLMQMYDASGRNLQLLTARLLAE